MKPNAAEPMQIDSLGDAALIVRVVTDFARDPEAALAAVMKARAQIQQAKIPGIIELAPAYATLAIFFDPTQTADVSELIDEIRAALTAETSAAATKRRVVTIPVCYLADFAPDLPDVAQHAGVSVGDATRRFTDARFRVSCVGFTPGFPYLSGLPAQLATPRRGTPRTQVPLGSVAIGGVQAGIYPQASPGGWNIIGRTPLRLFDASRAEPATLRAGDEVRFNSITREKFDRLANETTR